MNGAAVFIDILNGHGIDTIFCSPGSEWPPVWEELARRKAAGEPYPEYFNVRHEEAAVAMASGYAKATGRMAAVLIHTAPGTLNAGLGLRSALHEELPMLVCCGESIDFGEMAEFDPGGQWVRYLADIGGPVKYAAGCTKWSFGVNSRAVLASSVHRACQIAMSPPYGPVFLSIPFEVVHAPVAGPVPRSYPKPAPAGICANAGEAVDAIRKSKRPLIIVDTAGKDPNTVEQLVRLSELLSAPVVESSRQMYFNFPREHRLHGGFDPGPCLSEADLVFLIGAIAPWHPPSAGPRHAKVITLDVNPLRPDLPYWGYQIDVSLAGDIAASLKAILAELGKAPPSIDPAWREKSVSESAARRKNWLQVANNAKAGRPIEPYLFCHTLNEALPDGSIVVEETITHRMPIVQMLTRVGPGRYFGAESGGLGLGMGIALGIKTVRRDAPVVALIGDGSFNYNPVLACLGYAQEYRQPIVTIIMNNGGYLSMQRGITALYPHGWAARSNTFFGHGISPNPNYAALAGAFHAHGELIEDPDLIAPALQRAFTAERQGRSSILDVRLMSGL
jgi:thiamine pyrophosphate-dependent acetolactate synthase large subunit-like protein